MHHKQLPFFAAFSFTCKAFPSTVLPFSSCFPPWLVSSFMCYWKSGTGSCTSNLSISVLSPFLSLLVYIAIKWDLSGAWIKLCWIQIEVVKWPYYPSKPGPALEIRVQELVACPVCNLYWIHNSSYEIINISSLHTHQLLWYIYYLLPKHTHTLLQFLQCPAVTYNCFHAFGHLPTPGCLTLPISMACSSMFFFFGLTHFPGLMLVGLSWGKFLLEGDCPWMRGRTRG